MNEISLITPLIFPLATVLAPAVVAGLALQRLCASRSRNRLLYGAIALVNATLAVRILGEILSGGFEDPFIVIAALAAPIGWGIILWVVSSPGHVLYGRRDGGEGSGPARTHRGATRAGAPPLLLGEAARVTRTVAETNGARDAGPGPASGSRQAPARWRPAIPLPFVPGAGRQT